MKTIGQRAYEVSSSEFPGGGAWEQLNEAAQRAWERIGTRILNYSADPEVAFPMDVRMSEVERRLGLLEKWRHSA